MRIGKYELANSLIVAPMAGISDKPFRNLCLHYGAALAVSEMVSSNPDVWDSEKSRFRMNHYTEQGLRSVQIAGSDPELMAQAAQHNVSLGAQIIDINMGCPAKKVNKKIAGSALLQHPTLVKSILESVVNAVDVPVTLKIRTGWDADHKNGLDIAKIAEDCGVQALTIHGRTRQDLFKGNAEYDTIKTIKANIFIPVIANGDITSPEKAKFVLDYTEADGIMIGRAAQGKPWIFQEILHYLKTGKKAEPLSTLEQNKTMLEHVQSLHQFYGDHKGRLFARKHVGWYLSQRHATQTRSEFNRAPTTEEQLFILKKYFENQTPEFHLI
jgi:tRNA-dihydrouridine synthase B